MPAWWRQLPVGTLAKDGDLSVAVKAEDGHWARTDVADGLPMMGGSSMVGWTALVPIEAKEETTRAEPFADGTVHVGPQHWRDEPSRRLVTPWEEA